MSNIKVSLNKIAEFAYANPNRKNAIVKQHKDKIKSKQAGIGYREAENFLPGWINSQFDPAHLDTRLSDLLNLQRTTVGYDPKSGHVQGINNGVNALTWLTYLDPMPFNDVTFISQNQFSTDGLSYGNVFVKVRLNALVLRPKKGNRQARVGAIKFHFSKSTALKDEAGDLAAVALYEYLGRLTGLPAPPLHSLCCSIDAYRPSTRLAPKGHVSIHKDLVAACAQYEMIWNSLP